MTWCLWTDSCCSVCVRDKLSLLMVVVSEWFLLSISSTCLVNSSTRQLNASFSASFSLSASLSRSQSPSSERRNNSLVISWFSASSTLCRSWFLSSSSVASFNCSFLIFSCIHRQTDRQTDRHSRLSVHFNNDSYTNSDSNWNVQWSLWRCTQSSCVVV